MSLTTRCCHGTGKRWDFHKGDFRPCECAAALLGGETERVRAAEDVARPVAKVAAVSNDAPTGRISEK